MKSLHLSDEEIQLYALNSGLVSEEKHAHVESCESCRQKTQMYQLLFTTMEKPAAPIFDFDLAETVLQQLPQPKTAIADKRFVSYGIGGGVLLSIGVLFFYFAQYPAYLFAGLSAITLGILFTSALFLLLFLGYELYANYQEQIKRLNLSR